MLRARATLASAVAGGLVAGLLGGGLLVAGLVAPAGAAEATYDDPADATASLTDIRRVDIAHTTTKLRVVVGFTDLRRRSEAGPSGLTILIDTDKERRGAELGLSTGLQKGTDYQLMRIRRGRPVGEPLTCPHRVRLGFAGDRLTFDVSRTCLEEPARVRLRVKMRDEFDSSHPVVDWLRRPNSWTRWVLSS
ncbi:hypothetical protein [Nocardioides sp. YIM 152315]|uniref:hypothetical protein n=1 Tax=Nocardioides sp. YIM 152315 TaxID=3031760 RepID=UPI0023DC27B8|nr:hypothetical protein [Nocardioides sp. YIM 152315]MDF1603169.1 hypothetical protein [Nocardioides sp. YIM 152315]